MQVIKLGLISAVIFYMLIWSFSLLIPGTTVVSRIINITGNKDSLRRQLQSDGISYRDWLTGSDEKINIRTSNNSFYINDLFNSERQPNADTIYFEISNEKNAVLQGGIGMYQVVPDSTTTQLFYVFKTKWYKPWDKMALMINEGKYGPHMDSALAVLKRLAEKRN